MMSVGLWSERRRRLRETMNRVCVCSSERRREGLVEDNEGDGEVI